ncbi:hypothetical protein G7072_00790 [Nocardioides sp. HDW12B]|uniref:DUF5701 family protein n=1 Tax=Nocardioides sp. HDW12B TaxID=2714939 RepID=UPI00140BA3C1|nr:DUF5701 family protein [Nocardioides sp. HDW12B]QIK65064.1 hypothetical protein G7072_00790 [Nocardioides sp. HDW12B]
MDGDVTGTTSSGAAELDRQVDRLVEVGHPALAGLTEDAFRERLAPLHAVVPDDPADPPDPADPADPPPDQAMGFLLVVTAALVPTVAAVETWRVRGKAGWTDMADELAGFRPVPEVAVGLPDATAYLLLDVRTGRDTLGVRPSEAQPGILAAGRTPLTIDEGVALVTQRPDVFTTHHAFQALGSRADNARVPSFWVSKGAPRLGWCWWNNPHSWLGAASAAGRRGPA